MIPSIQLVLALSLASAALAQSHVKIGSWNIERLGAFDRSKNPRDEVPSARTNQQHPKALAEHIALAAVDVLALQEIYDTDSGEPIKNEKLEMTFELLNEDPSQEWSYVLFPNKNREDRSQLCGVAWNKKRVSMRGEPYKIPVAHGGWDRHPHAVQFTAGEGKTDFVVICVHMKSNSDGSRVGRRRRKDEARGLTAALPLVRKHFAGDQHDEEDIIVIGDTNILRSEYATLDYFEEAGLRDLNECEQATYVGSTAPFDRAFVSNQEEFRYTRQYALISSDTEKHDESLSDHHLILMSLRVLDDDDK